MRCRVYYEDTDSEGVVYHANYLKYCERARSEFFFEKHVLPESEEGVFVIRSIKADFFTPASLGQVLEIRTQIKEFKKVSVVLFQEIYCIQNASLESIAPFKVFASEIKFGFVDRHKYSPIVIPKLFRELLGAI
ncbi:YbgC/FadM family acyl-CoA thioesterase [Helicobacter pylori]|uniref:acyl-CoA thioesterase YbgC n=1 Tax=Helicobacter pylori TaxID=210 RepID=UPI00165CE584|nr:YbgC/FadM family acyl-CoA thioesterase [Helicobacter pylori]WQS04298.1 YbgC/FadM family acyl-CoA thioesterase [Helicobacter pylori]WQS12409.1 YbgC/FadM family acyl-CoA thioesterase [Helicobacter pylori]WQS20204.1 YbgC/FadM family acyl-CoA thioesterase [Helicobacter pylori]WQS29537.1 YbgC/FadM family acyl-CoA thioesterase [Helicobacter pylori]